MRRFLLVTQVYPPDPAAVGQHMADVAEALVRHGHEVTVLTSDRGYDDPNKKFTKRELRNGVLVMRLGFTSFGKRSMTHRLAGGLSLVLQSMTEVLFGSRYDEVLITSVPPFCGLVGVVAAAARQIPFDYWLMDLNPDQAIGLGRAEPQSVGVRLFNALNRAILRSARNVITLDEAMAQRFHAKRTRSPFPRIVAPWAPQGPSNWVPSENCPLRAEYGLQGKRVVMYAGNHSLAHPLDALFDAARHCDELGKLAFVFMGGGLAKVPLEDWVTREHPKHVRTLPYQPLEMVHEHLSMADVQVVVVGPGTVGVVHPSKIYGAMAAGRAILAIAPKQSSSARLVEENGLGWVVPCGDLPGLHAALQAIASATDEELEAMGRRALALANGPHSRQGQIAALLQIIES